MNNRGVIFQNSNEEGGILKTDVITCRLDIDILIFSSCQFVYREEGEEYGAREGDVHHFTDAASAKNTKTSTNIWLNAFPDSRVVLLIHNSIICRAI